MQIWRPWAVTRHRPPGALQSLVTWQQANRNALASAEAAVALAKRTLQEAVRKINVGPKDDAVIGSLPSLQATHQTALGGAGSGTCRRDHGRQCHVVPVISRRCGRRREPILAWDSPVRYASNLTATQVAALQKAAGAQPGAGSHGRAAVAGRDGAGQRQHPSDGHLRCDGTIAAVAHENAPSRGHDKAVRHSIPDSSLFLMRSKICI